jgi:cation diffusion facilitator CzcD-associated flavoprotein CzcO
VHRVRDGSGLAGQDEAGLTVLGFEDVVRRHVDFTGYDGAHARTAPPFAARMRHVDARVQQHVDKRGLLWPTDEMPMSVEIHFSYGHGTSVSRHDSRYRLPVSGDRESRIDAEPPPPTVATVTLDAVVVGAGFAGLYALHKLRSQGLSVRVFEAAPDVGGTWYFNRYPGARCDVESVDYCYSFSDELQQEWNWTEKYATQPEILRYLNWVADKLELRKDITVNARVTSAVLGEQTLRWTVTTDTGEAVTARFCLMATGPLSAAITPKFNGLETFESEVYHTAHWPHEDVDFTGKRVAVIGTGSSGIQSIPIIAEQAEQLYVFQRTPNYSVPAGNKPLTPDDMAEIKATYNERRRLSWRSGGGSPHIAHPKRTMEVVPEERRLAFEKRWQLGGVLFSKTFPDQMVDAAANDEARKFYEEKVRALIDNPQVADLLIPDDHPIGTKRICTDTHYFETFNRPNVELISVRKTPIQSIDATGIHTTDAHYDLDMIVLATGFDALTGALAKIDIVGRGGQMLRDDWRHGPRTYLGLGVDGFPNLFVVSGPGAPAVLANMVLHAEAHVNWIADCISHLDEHGYTGIEAQPDAVNLWIAECAARAEATLFPKADSWYMGANVPGKPRVFMLFVSGFAVYNDICAEVAAAGYSGFHLLEES